MAEQRAAVDRLAVTRRWIEIAPSGDWAAGLRDEEQLARVQAFLAEYAAPDLEIEAMAGDDAGLLRPARRVAGL
jgi:hypothetical protein